jgi:hypothetical protein
VFHAPPLASNSQISPASRQLIEEQLGRAENVFDLVGPVASLLSAWSIFEAASRTLLSDDLSAPQRPGRLLEVLAADGYVTPDEADTLRRLGRLRNEAAHGQLSVTFTWTDLKALADVTRILLEARDRASPGAA